MLGVSGPRYQRGLFSPREGARAEALRRSEGIVVPKRGQSAN